MSLPKWSDTEGWASRDPDVLSQLKAGYPRFYVPHIVRDLTNKLVKWAAQQPTVSIGSRKPTLLIPAPLPAAMIFPSLAMATACEEYLDKCDKAAADGAIAVLHVTFDGRVEIDDDARSESNPRPGQDLYMVLYPGQLASEAKSFWQHTGFGISSRCAAFWLKNAPFLHDQGTTGRSGIEAPPVQDAKDASLVLRRRIAGLYSTAPNRVAMEDVYLYPTGMSAISLTASTLQSFRSDASQIYRVAVFG